MASSRLTNLSPIASLSTRSTMRSTICMREIASDVSWTWARRHDHTQGKFNPIAAPCRRLTLTLCLQPPSVNSYEDRSTVATRTPAANASVLKSIVGELRAQIDKNLSNDQHTASSLPVFFQLHRHSRCQSSKLKHPCANRTLPSLYSHLSVQHAGEGCDNEKRVNLTGRTSFCGCSRHTCFGILTSRSSFLQAPFVLTHARRS
jgi:hypothetical protein